FPQRLQRYLAFELGCELSSLFHWLLYFNSVKQPVQLYGAGSEYTPPEIVEMTSEAEKEFYDEISNMKSDPIEGVKEKEEERIAFESLGIPYNTQGFVDLLTFEPPAFDLFDMDVNRTNSEKMTFQAVVGPSINTDGKLYVKKSDDQIVQVFSRSHQNCIIETKDKESGGFIQIMHFSPPNQTGSNQAQVATP
ncbi:hypothetical protein, partial [Coraliomargarita parva]|uniref:hypothetical protein n=1 Tax=Coraliomargarita parva TaxID=3014050 RepID=UPI0022B37C6E